MNLAKACARDGRRVPARIAAGAAGLILLGTGSPGAHASRPFGNAGAFSTPPLAASLLAAVPQPPAAPANEDSLEEFVPSFDPSDWDSVTTAYDASVRHDRLRRIAPVYGLRFNKAEGLHLEVGCSLRDLRLHLNDLELRTGYDTGREKAMGAIRARIALHAGEKWGLDVEAADQIRPFGNHQPYGNTWLTLGGYDAMQYQRERRLGIALSHRFSEGRHVRAGWLRLEQTAVPAVTDAHLFGGDHWMARNEPAEAFTGNGLRFHLRRGPTYEEETAVQGLVTDAELLVFGGALLHGDREYSRLQADAWYTRLNRNRAALRLRGSASLATGDAPRQAWPDLGGAAGLRAFPPRGEGAGISLIGTQRLLLRAEIRSPAATLRVRRVKALRNLGLKLVPFVEAGAVWGLDPDRADPSVLRIREIREWDDLRAPRRSEVHWDLGVGLRRDIDYSGILSYVEVDLAWPMGADTAPPRVTLQFSRDGLD